MRVGCLLQGHKWFYFKEKRTGYDTLTNMYRACERCGQIEENTGTSDGKPSWVVRTETRRVETFGPNGGVKLLTETPKRLREAAQKAMAAYYGSPDHGNVSMAEGGTLAVWDGSVAEYGGKR